MLLLLSCVDDDDSEDGGDDGESGDDDDDGDEGVDGGDDGDDGAADDDDDGDGVYEDCDDDDDAGDGGDGDGDGDGDRDGGSGGFRNFCVSSFICFTPMLWQLLFSIFDCSSNKASDLGKRIHGKRKSGGKKARASMQAEQEQQRNN